MDKIRVWEEEDGVGSRFAASMSSMWNFTNAVTHTCDGQDHMQNYRLLKFRSIMEAANWICDDALDGHMWVSELTILARKPKYWKHHNTTLQTHV